MNRKQSIPTYLEIQKYVKEKHRATVETCHIAHVKRDLGYKMRPRQTKGPRKKPCPEEFRPWIELAFRELA